MIPDLYTGIANVLLVTIKINLFKFSSLLMQESVRTQNIGDDRTRQTIAE